MRVHYSQFNLFSGPKPPTDHVLVEWRCPVCASGDVTENGEAQEFSDGFPETYAEMKPWLCKSCGHEAMGEVFARAKIRLPSVPYGEMGHPYRTPEELEADDSLTPLFDAAVPRVIRLNKRSRP
jgi:rubredoxin